MAKVDPYLRPLFDALHDMIDPERVSAHLERGVIEVAPLAFMRGRTLNDSFVILDEAQNTHARADEDVPHAAGFGSRMVVTGDITQIDLPREQRSGLVVVGDILDGVEGVEFVRFGGEDVVRHKLVQRIVAAYDEHAERQAPELRPADTRRRRARDAALDVEVLGDRAARRGRSGACCALALAPAGIDDGHVAVEFVDAGRDRRAQRRAPRQGRPDRRALVPGRRDGRVAPAPRELGDVVICPEHTEDLREAVVHGVLHLAGMDHETDDGRDARAAGARSCGVAQVA